MAWDNASNYVLLFGGSSVTGATLNQTWTFANGTWTNLTAVVTGAPPPLYAASMAYDPASQEVVLFGGENYTNVLQSDTWTYSDGVWTNATATVGPSPPPARNEPLTWDPTDQELVYVGSPFGGEYFAQTWAYRTSGWVNLTTVAPLGVIALSPMLAQDPTGGGLLMISDLLEGGTLYTMGEYHFSGGTWVNLTSSLPSDFPLLVAGSLVYLPFASAILAESPCVGTSGGGINYEAEAWEYSGGVWTDIATATGLDFAGGLYLHATLDPIDQGVVAFGENAAQGPPYYVPYMYELTPAPAVTAHASVSIVDVGMSIDFSGTVTGGFPLFQLSWSFGDGATATTLAATHSYSAPGLYNVIFNATDRVGRQATATAPVYVNPTPVVTVLVAPSLPSAGSNVSYFATVAGGTAPFTYAWNFGDSTTSSAATPTHSYAQPGTYSVVLHVTDATGTVASPSATQVVVSVAPTPPSGTSSSSSPSWTSGTGLLLLVGLVVVSLVAVAFAVLWLRRGPPTPPGPVAPPPAEPVPPQVPPGVG